jgi:hypothetical protein
MAANFGLVPHAAHRDAIELAADRRRDGLAERRLAGARGTDEAEYGAMRVAAAQLAHREVLDDALLRLIQPVVVLVERLLDLLQVDLLDRVLVPRQREDPVEVRADHLVLARCRRELAHALRLAPRLLHRALGQAGFLELAQRLHRFLLARIRLAQLGLDRAQLLAQVELALVLLDLHLGLALDVLHHARARDLALQPVEDEAQPLPDVEPLQDLVLVRDPEVHVRRREVGEPPRIGDVHLEDRRHLVRDAIDQVGERLGRGDDARHEVVHLVLVGRRLARGLDLGDRVGAVLRRSLDRDAPQPLQRDLDGLAGEVDALVHARGDADAADELVRVDRLVVVARGDDEGDDEPRILVVAQEREVLRGPHLHRDRAERIHDRGAERHQRKLRRELGLEDLFLALRTSHGGRLEKRVWRRAANLRGLRRPVKHQSRRRAAHARGSGRVPVADGSAAGRVI